MQAGTTSPRPRVSEIAILVLLVAGVALLLLLLLSFVVETRQESSSGGTPPGPGRVAYFEFGLSADSLWLVNPDNLTQRQRVFSVPHAREFGIVPSLAPDGRRLAYTALPANHPAPAPDTPAGLWVSDIAANTQPLLLTDTADLRVPAAWSPDGSALVYRRSGADGFALATQPVTGGEERVLAHSNPDEALFPVGFAPDSARFYAVALTEAGSRLLSIDVASGAQTELARLSSGLTREWSLSRDGRRLAFLDLKQTPDAISARAYILDLASGTLTPVTSAAVNAFGPVWQPDGALLVGTLGPSGQANLVRADGGSMTLLPGPGRGFDVPLGFSRDGMFYIVRAFSGASATAPGAATLTLVDENGERHVIASGDVTFAGWSAP
jgi:Tol biopolymer transport system component